METLDLLIEKGKEKVKDVKTLHPDHELYDAWDEYRSTEEQFNDKEVIVDYEKDRKMTIKELKNICSKDLVPVTEVLDDVVTKFVLAQGTKKGLEEVQTAAFYACVALGSDAVYLVTDGYMVLSFVSQLFGEIENNLTTYRKFAKAAKELEGEAICDSYIEDMDCEPVEANVPMNDKVKVKGDTIEFELEIEDVCNLRLEKDDKYVYLDSDIPDKNPTIDTLSFVIDIAEKLGYLEGKI